MAAHPPAWYRDPGDATCVRRWDGRAWTADVRPIPDWLRSLHLAPGPSSPLPGTTRRLWAVTAGLLLLAGVLMLFLRSGAGGDEQRVGDDSFLRRANERCAAAEAAVIGPNRGRSATGEAERAEAMAAGWEEMVADLRALPVREVDAPLVEGWLSAWERWASLRHEFAGHLHQGDVDGARRIEQASQESKRSINDFASAHGMRNCILR